YCRACSEWEIKPFYGEDQDCRFCGAQKAQATAGVTSTINNRELAKIIGMSDACVSVYTSGGFEYINPQALLCGLPLLCTEYSSGEDFVNQPFVTRLDGTYTYEVGTGFRKHVPNINTMIKFYKKICETPYDKKMEIGKEGRSWAAKTFDVNIIGKQLEEWIDNTPKHNWDFEIKKGVLKDPNAQIEDIKDNREWIKQLYNKILKCEPDPNGWNYWENLLKQGTQREQLTNQFRQIAMSDNQKLGQLQSKGLEDLLDNTGRKRFLIVGKESIGDLLYATALLDSFRESYPNYDLYLACDPQYNEIFDGNKNLHKIIPYNPIMENEITMTGSGDNKGYFDGYCHLFAGAQRVLNYLTQNKIALELK
ncbi:MAG: DUF4214 domain-containing protein, partial [Nanoarchaeota archaeon]